MYLKDVSFTVGKVCPDYKHYSIRTLYVFNGSIVLECCVRSRERKPLYYNGTVGYFEPLAITTM